MTYARNTTVSAIRTRNEIEETLERYGADGFAYATQGNLATVIFAMENRRIRFVLELPDPQEFRHNNHNPPRERSARGQQGKPMTKPAASVAGTVAGHQGQAGGRNGGHLHHRGRVPGQHRPARQHHRRRVVLPQIDQAYRTGNMPPLLPAAGNSGSRSAVRSRYRRPERLLRRKPR